MALGFIAGIQVGASEARPADVWNSKKARKKEIYDFLHSGNRLNWAISMGWMKHAELTDEGFAYWENVDLVQTSKG